MPLKTSSREELPTLNLTPMIDVVFLLIIFFMVGTQFSETERNIGIKLPGAGQLKAVLTPPDRKEVLVAADGSVYLDGHVLNLEQLTRQLTQWRAQYPDLQVVVRADGKVEHQIVASVYGAVNRSGVQDLAIAVRSQGMDVR
ncbi:MAG: biopolymer transporter ExbD [Planctomycetales bacterium]|nr:biopolymer transporter ExbD [Planctomycetales bacterium]